jgi:hypothetical protein
MKRRMPGGWIVKDITARNPTVRVLNPLIPKNKEVNVEYVSYGQEVQSQAGVQRKVIYQDEESKLDFFEEQQARTLATGGDLVITFTPVPGQIGWMYDAIYERAKYIYRTPLIRARIKERFGEDLPECEVTDSKEDITVIMAATDDNPIYADVAAEVSQREGRVITAKEYLDEFFQNRYGNDPDVVDARRFGLFRQLSGKVFKVFASRVHVISGAKYFPMGMPREWKHFRAIDYHQANPWAIPWVAVSPQDEVFVYRDAAFQPGRMTTFDIAGTVADMSGDYIFKGDFIDPLAGQTQVNTNTTTIDDLNRYFRQFRNEGRGTGGYWQPWDTKGTRGREEFTKRLINAARVGMPFNNKVVENDKTVILPTIWFLDDCRHTIEAMKNWRYEDWDSRDAESRNDLKEKPQNKWSHFPIAIECLLKNPAVSAARWGAEHKEERPKKEYFKTRR